MLRELIGFTYYRMFPVLNLVNDTVFIGHRLGLNQLMLIWKIAL